MFIQLRVICAVAGVEQVAAVRDRNSTDPEAEVPVENAEVHY